MNAVFLNELTEIKHHFRRLAGLSTDFFRERGIFLKKHYEDIGSKLRREYKTYIKKIRRLSKIEIIAMAKDISERKNIVDYISKNKISQDNLGLLLCQENLLEAIHFCIDKKEQDFTVESIKKALTLLTKQLAWDPRIVEKCLETFKKELIFAKKNKYKTVTFTLIKANSPPYRMRLSFDEFYICLDTDILDRYAKTEMPDFPYPKYYGGIGKNLFEKIRKKRFRSDFLRNCSRYSSRHDNGYIMNIDHLSKKELIEEDYTGVKNRYKLKEFISACYVSPERALAHIADYFKTRENIIASVREITSKQ